MLGPDPGQSPGNLLRGWGWGLLLRWGRFSAQGLDLSFGFAATELKPDVGTLELPPGTVRARLDADGSIVEVDEEEVQKVRAPVLHLKAHHLYGDSFGMIPCLPSWGLFHSFGWGRKEGTKQVKVAFYHLLLSQQANPSSLDYTEDLAALVSLNEASVLHVLHQRWQSQLPYTFSGPHLVALRPVPSMANSCRKVE